MRTTLDIDDDVLDAAKTLGRQTNRTAGAALSDLARRALTHSGSRKSGCSVGGIGASCRSRVAGVS
jgi:hypothetical protein